MVERERERGRESAPKEGKSWWMGFEILLWGIFALASSKKMESLER